MSWGRRILFLYLVFVIGLFLYSFTQIDLGLTFTSHASLHPIQTFFQRIGYFNRSLSTTLYIAIVGGLFGLYCILLSLVRKGRIEKRFVWKVIIITTVVLTFAYNAFSYDLFNYIFDARIVTYYHQNPYLHKALDYPTDFMLAFMHWTHRTYPYGPVWLGLTVPLSYAGLQNFLPTLILFKTLASLSFVLSVWMISKILRNIAPKYELAGIVFFAFNPLIIMESLVSAHNDISMMALSLVGFYFLTTKRHILSFVFQLFSAGVKFATVFLFPLHIYVWVRQKKGKLPWEKIILAAIFLMSCTVILATYRTNFQPWYLLFPLSYAALLANRQYVLVPSLIFTVVGLLQYIPFLYIGNWDPPIPDVLMAILAIGAALSVGILAFLTVLSKPLE